MGRTVYVHPTEGSDANPGTFAAPLRTLDRARTLGRGLPGCTVLLRGGAYRLYRPLAMDYRDDGTTWAAYPGETAVLSGVLPYTGISVGWGWGFAASRTPWARDNRVRANAVRDVMRVSNDGGGIYTNGVQAGLVVERNVLSDIAIPSTGGALYSDEGGLGVKFRQNVIARCTPRWMHEFNNIGGGTIADKYADVATNTVQTGNLTGEGGVAANAYGTLTVSADPESTAADIASEAGLTTPYEYLEGLAENR